MKTEKIQFSTLVNATPEKVYRTMLDEKTYRDWTAVFNPTSHYKGSWEKGTKILFLGTDKDGNQGGMVSRIAENVPNTFVSIEHYGVLKGNEEVTSGPEVDSWAGAHENYSFKDVGGKTELLVEMDSAEEWKSYFEEIWPKALEKLKAMCES